MKVVVTQPRTWTADPVQNFRGVERSQALAGVEVGPDDVLVLPELIGAAAACAQYQALVSDLALSLSCWVVGGSHQCHHPTGFVNHGVVCTPTGQVATELDKLNPYGPERDLGVQPGTRKGSFTVSGRRVVVALCADFFHPGWLAHERPDVVAVSAFSVTRLPFARPAREAWRHMTAARSYELGAYVAVSDWAPSASYDGAFSSGAAGTARPYPSTRGTYFKPIGKRTTATLAVDADMLDALRDDREQLGFLVREPPSKL